MKIGIYGGSFNPPHKMHKAIVDEILKKGYVDKIIVVPTADNYKKPNLVPGSFRVKMCEGIFKNNKRVEVSSFEVDGSLYTLNTLNHFHEKYPKADLYFILGTDLFATLEQWYKYEQILQNYQLLVIARDTNDYYKELAKFDKYKDKIKLANVKPRIISSTEIRNIIIKKGFPEELKKYLYVDTIKKLQKFDTKKYWN